MRKNNFMKVAGMCVLLYLVTAAILFTLLFLPSKACPVETGNFKTAGASYSNTVECGSNGCQLVGRKLIFWRPGLTPVLNKETDIKKIEKYCNEKSKTS